MSVPLLNPSLGVALATDITSVLLSPQRGFDTVIPDVVITEQHEDVLEITQHPVEVGASITDHAFKRPAEVSIRCLWSDSSFNSLLADPAASLLGGYSAEIYDTMLQLQASAMPFTLYTGKRVYPNMLIASLTVETSDETENSLALVAHCQQILIAQTTAATLPPASQQAMPQQTADPQPAGTQQPQAASPNVSALSSVSSGIHGFLNQ